MILESIAVGSLLAGLYQIYKINNHDIIEIEKRWKLIMSEIGITNKSEDTFTILNTFRKPYGHDCIISIPPGLSYQKLEKLKPEIESGMGYEVQMNPSGKTAYLKLYEKTGDKVHELKRKWEKVLLKAGIVNKQDETFKIKEVIIQEKYGYDFVIDLVNGLSYKKLEESMPLIESNFKCVTELEWKRFEGNAYLKLAIEDFDENIKFQPVATRPHEIYFSKTYFHENIIVDMNEMPHILIGGSTGSGKSRLLYILLTNLLYNHDDIELFLAQVSDKKDLQKFQYLKQTKYFAKNIQTTDILVKYLLNIQKERNRELNKYNLNNITEYNRRFSNKKMNYLYVAIDEFASLMPGDKETDPFYTIRKRCIFNLLELMRQARSAGIFIITAIQRPDRINMDVNVKSLFNIKVGFRQNTLAAAKVMTDDGATFKLPNREAIFIGSTDKILKTVYIDDSIIYSTLKDKIEKNHKYISLGLEKEEKNQNNSKSESLNENVIKLNKSKGDVKFNVIPNIKR